MQKTTTGGLSGQIGTCSASCSLESLNAENYSRRSLRSDENLESPLQPRVSIMQPTAARGLSGQYLTAKAGHKDVNSLTVTVDS